jgi:hypothetical protein
MRLPSAPGRPTRFSIAATRLPDQRLGGTAAREPAADVFADRHHGTAPKPEHHVDRPAASSTPRIERAPMRTSPESGSEIPR